MKRQQQLIRKRLKIEYDSNGNLLNKFRSSNFIEILIKDCERSDLSIKDQVLILRKIANELKKWSGIEIE